jgi:hypothetical protein
MVMKTTYLEYSKIILEKVCFDKILFEKELRKALPLLLLPEVAEFKLWCLERFGAIYPAIIVTCFQ